MSGDPYVSKKHAAEFIQSMNRLRSVRSYKPEKISDDSLKLILDAGRCAPSGFNVQPWHFIVVSQPGTLKKFGETFAEFVGSSAMVIVGLGDVKARPRWYEMEVTIALQHMILAAWMQGIGSCWLNIEAKEDQLKDMLGIPDELKVVGFVVFGYPAKIPDPPGRKPFDEVIHSEKF